MIVTTSYHTTIHAPCEQVWQSIRGGQFVPLVYKARPAGSETFAGKAELPSWCIPGRTVAFDRSATHGLAPAAGELAIEPERIDAVRYELEPREEATCVRLVVEFDAAPGITGVVQAFAERQYLRPALSKNLEALRSAVEGKVIELATVSC